MGLARCDAPLDVVFHSASVGNSRVDAQKMPFTGAALAQVTQSNSSEQHIVSYAMCVLKIERGCQ